MIQNHQPAIPRPRRKDPTKSKNIVAQFSKIFFATRGSKIALPQEGEEEKKTLLDVIKVIGCRLIDFHSLQSNDFQFSKFKSIFNPIIFWPSNDFDSIIH